MRAILLGLLLLLMLGLQQVQAYAHSSLGSRAALGLGFLLLAGFLVGELIARYGVPRISGYLLAGLACGPDVLGLMDAAVVEHLHLIDKLALVLIAFTAGAELRLASIKARFKAILSISMVQGAMIFSVTAGVFWFLRGQMSLLDGAEDGTALAVALSLGLIAMLNSPAAAVAVIVETRARGPLADTVLGVTVFKDLVVLVAFSLLMGLLVPALVRGVESAGGSSLASMGWVLLDMALSLLSGALVGLSMIAYLRFVNRQVMLFVMAVAFLLGSACDIFHLDPLLAGLVAGFLINNFSSQGELFSEGLERAAGPVFLVFFSLAGAGFHLDALFSLWPIVILFLVVRAGSVWLGTWLGSFVARTEEGIRRFGWTGFLGQAGLSLGLAVLVREQLPGVGAGVADLVVGAIVVNEILGPIAFRWALVRTGEARDES